MALFSFNTGKGSNFNSFMNKGSLKGMNYQDIMLQQTVQRDLAPRYCRYCGKDINAEKYDGLSPDMIEWQRDNDAHVSCHRQHLYEQGGRRI